jgi:NADPH-dependent 7-cyano-7-deazaguanine reductase QueF
MATPFFKRIYASLFNILVLVLLGFLVWEYIKKPVETDSSKILLYLDSMNTRNELLFSKIDSIQKVKTQLHTEYTKVNLKYDTIQISIDTMPDLEGTKLLLSISRQLTSKGVE